MWCKAQHVPVSGSTGVSNPAQRYMLGPVISTALLCCPTESVYGGRSRATEPVRVIVMRCGGAFDIGTFAGDMVDTRVR
jgi:hypothetical protein